MRLFARKTRFKVLCICALMLSVAILICGCSTEYIIESKVTGTTFAQTEPAAVPGYEIPLSAEKQQEIEERIGHPLNLDSDYSEYRYYGTYGDGIVLFSVPISLESFFDMEVAGMRFQHWNYFNINVYQDGKFYDLQEAYETGILTEAQIAEIAEYHRICDDNWRNR